MSAEYCPVNDEALALRQELLNAVASDLTRSAGNGWERIDAAFVLIGERVFTRVVAVSGSGKTPVASLPDSLVPMLGRLKSVMYVPGRGTWITLVCTVLSDGAFETGFDDRERPAVGEEMNRALAAELESYPRDRLPSWMSSGLEAHSRDLRYPWMVAELADVLPGMPFGSERRSAHRPGASAEYGPSDLYKPKIDRKTAAHLAEDFVPEEPGIEYFSVTYQYASEGSPVIIFLELDEDRLECRKIEIFPNGCIDTASITSEGAYTTLRDDPWPVTSELLEDGHVLTVSRIPPKHFQTEWLTVDGF
ncbi:hypothetical protein FNL39_101725 [Nocardia caishijiensis]|uniref:DUF6881 domain-containing protein n=1 Tax=Nocardia caishijiensis TaxID=184756 RepID=A0ABQ6YU05_9NOCA|nr:hypothetical protein FNL39_101725 [Nocardia caishijiensis]